MFEMSRNGLVIVRILVGYALVCSLTSIHFSTKQESSIDSDSDRANVPIQAARTAVKQINVTVGQWVSVEKQKSLGKDRVSLGNAIGRSATVSTTAVSRPLSLDSFRAKYAPIISSSSTKPPSKDKPVRIRALLFVNKGRPVAFRGGETWAIGDEVLNICMDGWKRSPYFEFVNATVVPDLDEQPDYVLQERQDIVWVVDMRRMLKGQNITLSFQLLDAARKTLEWQRQHNVTASLKVVLMDYRDRTATPNHCNKSVRNLVKLMGVGNVVSVRQQVVKRRHWNETAQFPSLGRFWNSSKDEACFGRPTLRVPYTVRSDYAEAVEEAYRQYLAAPEDSDNSTFLLPPDTVRTRADVAHFWTSKKVGSHAAVLRNAVTELVVSLNETTPFGSRLKPLRVIGGAVSVGLAMGRTKVSKNYLEALLTTKIVVVAQRDMWEDHYRLFEAISCGALVMTDPMLSLPDELVDGENIIVYHSLDHLRKLVHYYLDPARNDERLQIAHAGWKLAMGRHQTYHWMEELFFGQGISA
jgi:hypothetical protein